jgi:hypothetical protein
LLPLERDLADIRRNARGAALQKRRFDACGDFFRRLCRLSSPERKRFCSSACSRVSRRLATRKQVRVCDLNPDNIGAVKYGVTIDGPEQFAGSASWADAVFATGSTAVNGTLQGIVAARPDTVFYGVTITGVARLTGLRQFCYIMDAKGV